MISHRSLSDSKSPQVSGTLLSILAVVWVVSILLLSSNSSILFQILWGSFQVYQRLLVPPSPSFFTVSSALLQGLSISLFLFSFFLLSFIFSHWSIEAAISIWLQVLFSALFTRGLGFRLEFRDLFVSKTPDNPMYLIHILIFWELFPTSVNW